MQIYVRNVWPGITVGQSNNRTLGTIATFGVLLYPIRPVILVCGFICKRGVRSTGHLHETSVNGCEKTGSVCDSQGGNKWYNGKYGSQVIRCFYLNGWRDSDC